MSTNATLPFHDLSANMVAWAAFACFWDYFWGNIILLNILKEVFNFFSKILILKKYYYVKVYVIFFQNIYKFQKFWNLFIYPFSVKNTHYNAWWMFLNFFDSLDIFQINSNVPMIYYEPYHIKKSYAFNTNWLSLINMKS